MAYVITKLLILSGCLLVLLCVAPVQASPFFVKVYGRTYKVDSTELKGQKPHEVLEALPTDIARGPGFKPSHEQVLAEVEERTWIVDTQLTNKVADGPLFREGQYTGMDVTAVEPQTTGSLANGAAGAREPELQALYDRHRALNLLLKVLRRSIGLPSPTPKAGFSRPKLSPEIEVNYRSLNFEPGEAYYAYRRVRAAFRSGDIHLLARVVHYPLLVTLKSKRAIRNRDQLVIAKEAIMSPRLREIVAQSSFESVFVRDKGMMLGDGAIWITPDNGSFKLQAINLP